MSKRQVAGYILDKRIGKGSYATVWRGHVDGANDVVAVKVISRQTVTETTQLRQEVEVLRRISHTNIVRFRDLKKSASHFYLVLEYCSGGDLSQFLRARTRVQEDTARRFLTQIGAGLCVLHRENVIHRDLKPQNILLSDSSDTPVLKIADFGFARALQPTDMAATVCGSPLYMAPEILRHERYDAKADLWSVGAILYELILGRPPFSGANPMQLLANIEKCDRVMFDGATVSSDCQDFLRSLLQKDPKKRMSCGEFAVHSYVSLGPLPDPRETMARSTEGIMFSSDGSSLLVPCEWCLPSPEGPQGASSPLVASPPCGPSREASPVGERKHGEDNAAAPVVLSLIEQPEQPPEPPATAADLEPAPAATAEHTACAQEAVKSPPDDEVRAAAPEQTPLVPDDGTFAAARPGAVGFVGVRPGGAWLDDAEGPGDVVSPRKAGMEEEYVMISEQKAPISALTGGCGRGGGDFCGNLSRIAHTLEHLAIRRLEQFPVDALALLVRALGLLEKALNVSMDSEPLRVAFARMLEAAEVAERQIRAPSSTEHPPGMPNQLIFDFAVQQAKDAAVALSKQVDEGGWEAFCHEKLTLSLLLFDLLGSEADGEDLSTLSSYTAPIARIVGEIERLQRAGSDRPRPASGGRPVPAFGAA
eukprot:gnl/TRDRNA2_/TRDRNA2_115093_c1_seq1.p1 gnl/TRDRNA2_/TRDRNA2_115093_c1~~gnl/TRDRNA2_/TRDRNA2_115093_c1_seq1.p1  ORF type:complete len:649 (+),score=118.70 gnl/TRDRNA2_/TRDRNA2_115093_c1_seq1:41-1987(+)